MSNLGDLFAKTRNDLLLSPKQVAALAGYKNIDKGIRRYLQIEEGHNLFPHREVLTRFRQALNIDVADIFLAQSLDFEDLDRPIQPYIIYRFVPGFHVKMELHADCTREQAVMTAKKLACRLEVRTCLVVSRVRCLFVDPDGSSDEAIGVPATQIGTSNKMAMRLTKQVIQIPKEPSSPRS